MGVTMKDLFSVAGWLAFQAPRGDGSFMTSTRAPGRVLGWSEARARRFLLSLTEHGP